MYKNTNKVVVLLGPTSSGKTSLAVKIAHFFDGEIVSADSRQVYKGMDVGTGKDLNEYFFKTKKEGGKNAIVNIPYHLIDVVKPNTDFNLVKYIIKATSAIYDIQNRGKLPIVVGGTGLYLQALVDGYTLSSTKPDVEFRKKLDGEDTKIVFEELKKIDKNFAERLNNSDKNNKRRLIRYIEIIKDGNNVSRKGKSPFNFLVMGLNCRKNVLDKRIFKRLVNRIENEDMIGEVRRLHKEGVSWKRLMNFGLEYKFITKYLRGGYSYDEMVDKLNIAIVKFAKRQMTWFKRWERQGREIVWIKNQTESYREIKVFLKKNG